MYDTHEKRIQYARDILEPRGFDEEDGWFLRTGTWEQICVTADDILILGFNDQTCAHTRISVTFSHQDFAARLKGAADLICPIL